MTSSDIQFIHSSHQLDVQSQRRAHAHAARITHARRRRFRIIEYRASKKMQIARDDTIDVESRPVSEEDTCFSWKKSSPVIHAYPFASSARSFNQVEHFLFEYCRSEQASYHLRLLKKKKKNRI